MCYGVFKNMHRTERQERKDIYSHRLKHLKIIKFFKEGMK